jgi:hypothetical protein
MNYNMLIVWFLNLFILSNVIVAQPPTCYRSSRYLVPQTPGDNGFRITVEGSFKTYVPGRTYKGIIERKKVDLLLVLFSIIKRF